MRLWSLSPAYLDRLGLLGVWREALLAQQVLAGNTQGYKHHPQLIRFRNQDDPLSTIGTYLYHLAEEGHKRGYNFQRDKILSSRRISPIPVPRGQLMYEFSHLMEKLRDRAPDHFRDMKGISDPQTHPSFRVVPGGIAPWEKTSKT